MEDASAIIYNIANILSHTDLQIIYTFNIYSIYFQMTYVHVYSSDVIWIYIYVFSKGCALAKRLLLEQKHRII